MYETVNETQFIHKINLSKLAKSSLSIADEENITEADICIMAGMLYTLHDKNDNDLNSIATTSLLFTKQDMRRLRNGKKKLFNELIDAIAGSIFATYSSMKVVSAFNISINELDGPVNIEFNKYLLSYLKGCYVGDDDETFVEDFMKLAEKRDFANAVRLYLIALATCRFSLIEKLTLIQYKSFNKNFMYAFNQEIITIINLIMVNNGGKKIELLSDETMNICNEVVSESNKKINDLQYEFVLKEMELNNRISEQDLMIKELKAVIKELEDKIHEYENVKILKDKNVLIISDDTHKEGYKNIVERHGGNFEFISGVNSDVKYIVNRARSNDLVFFCTAYTKHKLFQAGIKDLDNIIYVNSVGLDSLEREIIKLR